MIDLDELMRLHDAATPGPWKVKSGDFESEDGYGTVTAPYVEADGKTICVPFDRGPDDENDEADAAYIVAACNAVPELVARIRELEAERDWMAKAAANAGWHGVRVGKEYMIDQARIAVSRAQAEQHECPTPEVSCHARDGKLCMSNNHLACAQAVNKKSLKQVSALEPCRIVSNNNSTPPEGFMYEF